MKIIERKLFEDDVIVRGYPVNRRSIIINGDTYTLEINYGGVTFFKNRGIIAKDCEAYIEFEKATGIQAKHFSKYLDKIKYSRFKDCCKKKATWMRGHPGEHLLICPVCNQVLDTEVCFGEIM